MAGSLVRLVSAVRSTSSPVAVAILVAANLGPLVGLLFFDWDLFSILVLYWMENGVIGALNVVKMGLAQGVGGPGSAVGVRLGSATAGVAGPILKAALIPFFCVHYGIFWLVHGLFVFVMFGGVLGGFMGRDTPGGGPSPTAIGLALLGLTLSHGASFWFNYVGRGEFRTASSIALFTAPYGRLVVLHVTILVGGMLAMAFGAPVLALLVLVVLKTGLDLTFHLREHRHAATRAPVVIPAVAPPRD